MLIYGSLVVFAITLILTKAAITASKREFVTQRYTAAKLFSKPPFIHTWFYKMWTCPMCSGFWFSLIVAVYFYSFGYFFDVLIIFGLNWLWHCLESTLFFSYKFLEFLTDPKNNLTNENK